MIQPPSSGPDHRRDQRRHRPHRRAPCRPSPSDSSTAAASATAGSSGPATAPCSTRNTISMPRVGASPHRNEASTNSTIDAMNRRTWPKRCVSQPVSGTEIALATRERGDDPGALVGRDAEVAGDRRDRDVRDRRVEHVHERRQRQRDRAERPACRRSAARAPRERAVRGSGRAGASRTWLSHAGAAAARAQRTCA